MHVILLPEDFAGDDPAGALPLVARVRGALNVRFPGCRPPRVLFTDRGRGFYNTGTGKITDEYRDALTAHALTAFMADDASRQPGSLQELMLHETAVAWVRRGLTWTLPARPWEETTEAFGARLREVVRKVNDEYNVEGLCRELPTRVEILYDAEGGKLQK